MTEQTTLGMGWTTSRRGVRHVRPLMPKWAEELIERVLTDEGGVSWPEMIWEANYGTAWDRSVRQGDLWGDGPDTIYNRTRRIRSGSSGTTWAVWGRIRIMAGTELWGQRMVLLHELAHYLLPAGEKHGPAFWAKAWELYFRYVPTRDEIDKIRMSERAYKAGSEPAYYRAENSLWTVRAQEE